MSGVNTLVESTAEVIAQTRDVSRSEMAAVTILTYDIIVTMGDEIELIWSRKWTFAKAMYIVARYIPWAFQLAFIAINADGTTGLFFSVPECHRWIAVQAVILQLIISTVDIVLMTRVYALYNRNFKLTATLGVLFCAEVAYLSYVLSVVSPRLTFNADCFVTSSPKIFVSYWIVSLVFETILFLLTLYKFIHAVHDGWGKRPVMQQFVGDGTWAYFLIFFAMLINSLLYKLVHTPLAGICFTWLLSVLSFAGSRLILNPRKRSLLPASNIQNTAIELDDVPLSPLSPVSPHSPYTEYTERSPVTPTTPPGIFRGGSGARKGRTRRSQYEEDMYGDEDVESGGGMDADGGYWGGSDVDVEMEVQVDVEVVSSRDV
ncbi:hypothetical protein EUX98_g6843 [Antrodiella citrinella]|uniref:DUF6533 domain-containing protein n=1 Tax=Antrodiella citrinella TaxID=2447956 RepID=A0A4S4MNT5_9APHY|nr:hypothetical protein EUX98_g6843 [Antrodiella citrinella]